MSWDEELYCDKILNVKSTALVRAMHGKSAYGKKCEKRCFLHLEYLQYDTSSAHFLDIGIAPNSPMKIYRIGTEKTWFCSQFGSKFVLAWKIKLNELQRKTFLGKPPIFVIVSLKIRKRHAYAHINTKKILKKIL